jgi:hypothetical protein
MDPVKESRREEERFETFQPKERRAVKRKGPRM